MQFDLDNIKKWTRLKIWNAAFTLISQRPLLGYGAATFSLFYISKYSFGHLHNMPLQLAFDYGIPLAILLCGFVTVLIIKSWFVIMHKTNNNTSEIINKSWLTASIVTTLSHLNDISYYDGKISILIWILFAGLVCINDEKQYKY